MPSSKLLIDSLWRCLCPSFEVSTFHTLSRVAPRRAPHFNPLPCISSSPYLRHKSNLTGSLNFNPKSYATYSYDQLRLPHDEDFWKTLPEKSTEQLYEDLLSQASRGYIEDVERLVKYLIGERGQQPNLRLYRALILANINPPHGSAESVISILQELAAEGLEPDAGICYSVIKVLAVHPNFILRNEIIQYISERWVDLPAQVHYDVVAGLIREGQFEMAIKKLEDFSVHAIPYPNWLRGMLIHSLCKVEEIEEAFRQIKLAEDQAPNALSGPIWYHFLDAASSTYHHEATLHAWRRRVHTWYLNPPTGICLNVLETASRAGDVKLGLDVFRVLGNRKHVFTIHQYDALIDTYIKANNLPGAFSLMCAMASSGVVPDRGSTRSAVAYMKDNKIPWSNALAMLRQLKETKKDIPVEAVNVVLEIMANSSSQLAPAMDIYNNLHELCKFGANITTFTHLFRCCRTSSNPDRKDTAMYLASEMIALKVSPDSTIFDDIIGICTGTGALDYALQYYTEMRDAGFKPTEATLSELIIATAKAKDRNCYRLLDDLKTDGATRTRYLQEIIVVNMRETMQTSRPTDVQQLATA